MRHHGEHVAGTPDYSGTIRQGYISVVVKLP